MFSITIPHNCTFLKDFFKHTDDLSLCDQKVQINCDSSTNWSPENFPAVQRRHDKNFHRFKPIVAKRYIRSSITTTYSKSYHLSRTGFIGIISVRSLEEWGFGDYYYAVHTHLVPKLNSKCEIRNNITELFTNFSVHTFGYMANITWVRYPKQNDIIIAHFLSGLTIKV